MNRDSKFFYAISLVTQIGLFIVVTLSILVLGGYWLDQKLKSSPLFLLFGLFLSAFVIPYGVYKLILPLLEKNKKSKIP